MLTGILTLKLNGSAEIHIPSRGFTVSFPAGDRGGAEFSRFTAANALTLGTILSEETAEIRLTPRAEVYYFRKAA